MVHSTRLIGVDSWVILAGDVAVISNDELLVVDGRHGCIYRFTLDGDYIGKFIIHGNELCYPLSITIDPNDLLIVVIILQVVTNLEILYTSLDLHT